MKYTIVFTEKQERRLEELAKKLEMSKAETVRRAIEVLGAIASEVVDSPDKTVQIVDKNDPSKKVQLVTFIS